MRGEDDRVKFEMVVNAGTSAVQNSWSAKVRHNTHFFDEAQHKNELSRFTFMERKSLEGILTRFHFEK